MLISLLQKLRKSFMDRGLKFRIMLCFITVTVLSLSVPYFFSYQWFINYMQNSTSSYVSKIIDEINVNIFIRLKGIDDISKVVLNSTVAKRLLSASPAPEDASKAEEDMRQLLKSIIYSNDYITSAYILTEKYDKIYAAGEISSSTYDFPNYFSKGFPTEYRSDPLYSETLTQPNNYKWWDTQSVYGKNVFVLSRKLFDINEGNLGVLVIHLNSDLLNDINTRLKMSIPITVFLASEKGDVLYHPDKQKIYTHLESSGYFHLLLKGDRGFFINDEAGEKELIVYNSFILTHWKLIARVPLKALTSEAEKLARLTSVIAAVLLLLIGVLSHFISKSIIKPVHRLIHLMENGSGGDMNARFHAKYQDEIGKLGNTYNKMMDDILQLIEKVAYESLQKEKAQIEALEANINPHFLYNTLASVYWNAQASGNTEIAQIVSALSKFFKLGLNKGNEFTTVEAEAEHVRQYLTIQKTLNKNKLDYVIHADPNALRHKTIKLILQTLAENAILHGIENSSNTRGLIHINIKKSGGFIIYRVADNGAGIAGMNLAKLNEIIDNGYGLKNLKKRLELYFGENYHINCISIPNEETIFEVVIPVDQSEGGD